MEILTQIQSDILYDKIPLSAVFRKARVLSAELESDELAYWVSNELDGYDDLEALPDYRWLNTSVVGTWTNGYWTVKNKGVILSQIDDDDLKKFLSKYPVQKGIKSLEQYTSMEKEEHFLVPADTVAYLNSIVGENGYGFSHLFYTISAYDFEQILDTIRNRLLEFILKLGKKWNPKNQQIEQSELKNLIKVEIYNNPIEGNQTIFDQRNQRVDYQFNSSGNISIENINNISDALNQIEYLKNEIQKAEKQKIIPRTKAIEAEYHLEQAIKEGRSNKPNRKKIIEFLEKSSSIIKDVAALASMTVNIIRLIEIVNNI